MKKLKQKLSQKTQEGFTIVEVMLVLAISGLLLIGVIGGTYTSISQQRYMDALRDFAEYLRTAYSEVISPQSLGLGNSSDYAILGKAIVFGADDNSNTVYSATIIGKADIPVSKNESFIEELSKPDYNVQLFCGDSSKNPDDRGYNSTVMSYTPLWQAELRQVTDNALGTNFRNKLKGTLIIARSLTSATVHTAFLKDTTYNLQEQCTPNNHTASNLFSEDLRSRSGEYEVSLNRDTGVCVKTDESAISREVRIAADGRNTSAIHIMDDDEDNRCR